VSGRKYVPYPSRARVYGISLARDRSAIPMTHVGSLRRRSGRFERCLAQSPLPTTVIGPAIAMFLYRPF
jgi:hypothetical protein